MKLLFSKEISDRFWNTFAEKKIIEILHVGNCGKSYRLKSKW